MALQLGQPWSVIVDADVLIGRRFFSFYLPNAMRLNPPTQLGFAFRLWDRFYASPKYRGLHVYRTELLPRALKKIPKDGLVLRPETYIKEQLELEGIGWMRYSNVVGLHDFFQHPRDIFAKMALRAHRSGADVDSLLRSFEKWRGEHVDFVVASEGLKYGMKMDPRFVDNARSTYLTAFDGVLESLSKTILSDEVRLTENLYVDRLIFRQLSRTAMGLAVRNYFCLSHGR